MNAGCQPRTDSGFMRRALPLLLALLLPSAGARLCTVTAESRPIFWASSLRTITVTLDPDCPADGEALIHLGGYGGPGSRRVGPAVRLDAEHPVIVFGGQPTWRTVLWEAENKRLYQVQIPQEVRGEPGDE